MTVPDERPLSAPAALPSGTRGRPPVLVLRYNPEAASRLAGVLGVAGHPVVLSDSFRELGDQVRRSPMPPLVILAGGLTEPAAWEFLRSLRERPQRVPVLALAEGLGRERIEALRRLGVDEVLEEPLDPAEARLVVRHLFERSELERSTRILGRTAAIQEVLEKVAQFAPVSSTVLIEGESGTGKELIAQAIHARSPRAAHAFVAVNCAALTETLLESELFGHERGAFTGAVAQRKGRFELADRGTLFLDEVGEMPPATQVKLLRAVEEREFVRVGGSETVQVDVRVIAATNKVLREAVERGEFRRDLYYRLNVLHIDVPPLRDRRDDIPLLVERFVQEFAAEHGREPVEVSDEAMAILQNYDWPGNVRELRNQVERMVVLTYGSRIRARDIPAYIYERANPGRLLPVAAFRGEAGDREALEREFIYRYLFELKRDVTEIKELLDDVSYRGHLLAEVSLPAGSDVDEEAAPADTREPAREQPPPGAAGALSGPVREPPQRSTGANGTGAGAAGAAAGPAGDAAQGSAGVGPARPAPGGPESALAPGAASSPEGLRFELGMSLEELERQAIQLTLAGVKGNRRRAASLLGIGERTLYRKLKEYELA